MSLAVKSLEHSLKRGPNFDNTESLECRIRSHSFLSYDSKNEAFSLRKLSPGDSVRISVSLGEVSLSSKHFGRVAERLELDGIATRIEDEHDPLLSDLTLVSSLWSYHEIDPGSAQPGFHLAKGFKTQHAPKVRDRNRNSIDLTAEVRFGKMGVYMRGELMSKEIEIKPPISGTTLGASKNLHVEASRALEVFNLERKMERSHFCVLPGSSRSLFDTRVHPVQSRQSRQSYRSVKRPVRAITLRGGAGAPSQEDRMRKG